MRRLGFSSIPEAVSSIEIDYNRDLDDLAELLASVKRPGSFYASGSIETPMPRLEIEGVGTIAFPVLDHQAKAIVAQAERAPYGRGEATLVDTRVRRAWQIAPGKIRLGGKGWENALDSVLIPEDSEELVQTAGVVLEHRVAQRETDQVCAVACRLREDSGEMLALEGDVFMSFANFKR